MYMVWTEFVYLFYQKDKPQTVPVIKSYTDCSTQAKNCFFSNTTLIKLDFSANGSILHTVFYTEGKGNKIGAR